MGFLLAPPDLVPRTSQLAEISVWPTQARPSPTNGCKRDPRGRSTLRGDQPQPLPSPGHARLQAAQTHRPPLQTAVCKPFIRL
jgi:hypothetical protein